MWTIFENAMEFVGANATPSFIIGLGIVLFPLMLLATLMIGNWVLFG